MPKKSRTHSFVIVITTDKPCSSRVALREANDSIYGLFYCTQREDREPETFRVRTIRRQKNGDRR